MKKNTFKNPRATYGCFSVLIVLVLVFVLYMVLKPSNDKFELAGYWDSPQAVVKVYRVHGDYTEDILKDHALNELTGRRFKTIFYYQDTTKIWHVDKAANLEQALQAAGRPGAIAGAWLTPEQNGAPEEKKFIMHPLE